MNKKIEDLFEVKRTERKTEEEMNEGVESTQNEFTSNLKRNVIYKLKVIIMI